MRHRVPFIAAFILLIASGALAQTSYVSVASGAWNQPATWSPPGVPAAVDSVTIQGGHTITLDAARSVSVLAIGGTLNVAGYPLDTTGIEITGKVTGSTGGRVTLTGTGTWNGGSLEGSGATLTVASGATLTIGTTAAKTVASSFTLQVLGTAVWTGGSIYLNSSSLLKVEAGGVFDAQGNGTITNSYYNGTFTNAGTWRKSAGTGATTVASGIPVTSSGRIDVLSGTMSASSMTLAAGSVISGSGFHHAAGSLTLSGASTVETGSVMTLSGGSLTGTSSLTIDGTLNWTGGTMGGSGGSVVVPAAGTLNLTGSAAKTLASSFSLVNNGTVHWLGGQLVLNSSSLLTNAAGALFSVECDSSLVNTYYNGTFRNDGTFRKTVTSGTTALASGVPFQNAGRIEILTGTMTAPSVTLLANGIIAGTGFTVNGGVLNVAGTASVESGSSMTFSAGEISGAGTLTVSGTLHWLGGTMTGSTGSVTVASGGTLVISGTATKTLQSSYDLVNHGTIRWTGGALVVNSSAILNNAAGGLFSVECDASLYATYYNGSVTNAGTFRKSLTSGTTAVTGSVPFNSSGTIDVQSGTLQLAAGGTQSGAFNIAIGAFLRFTAGTHTWNGPTSTGKGLEIAGATVNVASTTSIPDLAISSGALGGTATLTISNTLDWSGGTMQSAGTTLIAAAAQLNVTGAAAKTIESSRLLRNAGFVSWTGSGSFVLNSSSIFTNLAGGVFDIGTDASLTATYYNGTLVNEGTLRKTSGTLTSLSSSVPFTNSGRVEVLAGTLSIPAATFNGGSVIAGTGFRVSSGTTTIAGTTTVESGSSMTFSGGSIRGTSTLTVAGTFDWTGGTFDGAGTAAVTPAGLLKMSGTGTKTIAGGRTLSNGGTIEWTGGSFAINSSSLFTNLASGLFLIATDSDVVATYYNGSFSNAGTIRKEGATGSTMIGASIPFSSSGTIEVRSGELQVTNPTFSASSILKFGIGGTAALTGFGRLSVTSGVTLNGTIAIDVIAPFVPQGGDAFAVITHGTRTGSLSESLAFGSGRSFATTYNVSNLTLTASGPTITAALSPASGTTGGGTSVSIAGTGFAATPAVSFGGTAARSVSFVDSSHITATTPAYASGAVDVVVTNPDGQPTTARSAFTFIDNGDLSLAKIASASRVATGSAFSYAITVSNSGPSAASSVVVTDTLPAGLTLGGHGGTGWTCSADAATPPTITCTMASLAAGAASPITINVTAPSAAAASLTNTASVTSATVDPAPSNNSGSATIEIAEPAASIAVTSAADSGPGTLRQALLDLGNGFCTAPCTITFDLSTLAPIQPLTALPTIAGALLDGATQPGYSGSPLVELNGSLCSCSNGLELRGSNGHVRALAVTGFSGNAIDLAEGGAHRVTGSRVGVTPSGTVAANGTGIHVASGQNVIGGSSADGNVISGNAGSGIRIDGGVPVRVVDGRGVRSDVAVGADGTVVEGNFIGTDASGTAAIGNVTGISIALASGTVVRNNTIAYNSGDAVFVEAGVSNLVTGNSIYANGESGIDLLSLPEPTTNDAGDSDAGANNLQNAPVVVSAALAGSSLRVTLDVDSADVASTGSITVELFRADGSASPQGATPLATACFDGNSLSAALLTAPAGSIVAGALVVANATSYAGTCADPLRSVNDGTSEFSAAAAVAGCTPPSVSISAPTNFICTGESLSLQSLVSGGTAPYTYLWSVGGAPIAGATFPGYLASSGGSYTLTVTDATGCSATSATFVLTQLTPPTVSVSASGPTAFCDGGSVVLTATSAASYLWSTGEATQSITVTQSGSYTVTVRDVAHCSATSAPVTVTVTPRPASTVTAVGPTTFCEGGSVVLTASPGSSWLWSTGATTQSITVTQSGNYSVTVTDGGCSATSAPLPVTANPPVPPIVTAAGPTVFCDGGSVVLTATSGSGWQWSRDGAPVSGANTATLTATESGSYTVAVTDANGCAATSLPLTVTEVVPPAASISAGGPTSFCEGSSVVLTVSTTASSWLWSTGEATPSITVTRSGSYFVTAHGAAGCNTTSSPVTVTVSPQPTATITVGGPTTFCQGGSVTLTASAGSAWQWARNGSPIAGATTATFTATESDSYTVTVRDSNGCSAVSPAVLVDVLTAVPTPTVTASGPTSFCDGSTVTLTAAGGTVYQWLKGGSPIAGATTGTLLVTLPGTYSVQSGTGACASTSAPVVVTVGTLPSVVISGPESICAGATATLDAGHGYASYLWSTGERTQQIVVAPRDTTIFGVTVADSTGCKAEGSHRVAILPAPDATIRAALSAVAGSSGNSASVTTPAGGAAFAWTIDGGAIASGQGTSAITWTAGTSPAATLGVTVTTPGGCASSATQVVTLTNAADLGVTVAASATTVVVGGTAAFSIGVTNGGPSLASSVVLEISLPEDATLLAVDTGGWSCASRVAAVDCTIAQAPVGTLPSLLLHLAVPPRTGELTLGTVVSSATPDPSPANDRASASVTVTAPACGSTPPQPVSPSQDEANVASPVTFTWFPSPGATRYDLWLASDGGAPAVIASSAGTAVTVAVGGRGAVWYVEALFEQDCPSLLSARRSFTLAQQPVCETAASDPVSPAAGAVVASPVTFSWTAVANAIGYQLFAIVEGGAIQDLGTTDSATTTLTVPTPAGSLRWFVDALLPGCPATRSRTVTFTVPAPDPCEGHAAASLTAPADGSRTSSSAVRLEWTASPDADGYRIWARVGDQDFAVLGVTTISTATVLDVTIPSGRVEWYVETLYNGCRSFDSARRTFDVPKAETCGTALPELLSPSHGSVVSDALVTFAWTAPPGALGYEVWLALNDGTPVLFGTTTGTTLTKEVAGGALDWFVRASFDGCPLRESASRRFTFAPPPACSGDRASLQQPVNGAGGVHTPVDLSWTEVEGATGYRVWISSRGWPARLAGTAAGTELAGVSVPPGPTQWFVETTFAEGCAPTSSTPGHFIAVSPGPPCTTPEQPQIVATASASSGTTYSLDWLNVGGNDLAVIEESRSGDFTDAVSQSTRARRAWFTHQIGGSSPQTYYYRVRAIAVCQDGRRLYGPYSTVAAVAVLPPNPLSRGSHLAGSSPAFFRQVIAYGIPLDASLAGLNFVAHASRPWITVTPSSGIVPAGGIILDVTVRTKGLPVGTSAGDVTITTSSPPVPGNAVSHGTTVFTTGVTVNLVSPVLSAPKNAPPPDALIIPAVAHADGINARFQSDVRVTNTSPQTMKYQLTFTPTGEEGIAAGVQTTLDVEPGRTVAIDDVLGTWFNSGRFASATGTLEIRPLTQVATSTSGLSSSGLQNLVTFASSRTFNVASHGTFGQYIPAIPFANFVGRGEGPRIAALSLQQLAQTTTHRTNLGLVEGSGVPASLLVSVFGSSGAKLKELTVNLNGGEHRQLNSFLAQQGLEVSDARVEVRVTSAGGKVTAYASVLDNATGDPMLVTPALIGQAGSTRWVLPGVADLETSAARWRTDARIFNASSQPVEATLTYYSQRGGTPLVKELALSANEVRQLDGIVNSLFGVTDDGGALHVTTSTAANLVASARIFNPSATGTSGQFIAAVTPADATGTGFRPLQILQVEESSRYRSNVGIAEVGGKRTKVELSAILADSKVTPVLQLELAPFEFRQIPSLLKAMGLSDGYNVRVSVKVVEGGGRVVAYASVIDLSTQDPTYVPAQ